MQSEEINLILQMDQIIENKIKRINAGTKADTPGSNQSSKISKPPQALLDVRPQSYEPQLLTIGPLHGVLRESSSVDRCKELCVSTFMQRQDIFDLRKLMQRLFDDPQSFLDTHYSNAPQHGHETLQLMLTLDTIFIYELCLFACPIDSTSPTERYEHFQTLRKNGITTNQFLRDLFLMGNQIPMSFLMKVIEDFPKKPNLQKDDLNKTLVGVVEAVDPFLVRNSEDENFEFPDFCKCSHLLDCLYVWVITERPKKNKPPCMNRCRFPRPHNSFQTEQAAHKITMDCARLPTASQLSKAGIRFTAIEGGSISMMYYDKSSLRLYLPRLAVYDKTEDVLRNLLAHEQTSKDTGEITKYAFIMDSLIDTPEDVAILTKSNVIENFLGSDERLVQMWNDMCINVSDRSCKIWDDMICDILQHHDNPWHPIYVEFRERYFSRPWLTISLIVGILLLLFSLVQTGYTVAGYYQSKP